MSENSAVASQKTKKKTKTKTNGNKETKLKKIRFGNSSESRNTEKTELKK